MKLLRIFRERAESGQAMIFFAVLLSTLCMTTGLAVEGGNMMVQYRKLQSAADMAALIGAQKLPCGTTASPADIQCRASAEQQACDDAASNGFKDCTAGGAGSPSANVPPKTCSPYDFIDYGNGSSNASCISASAPTSYSYIEVRLQKNFGNVPIFNIPVTLSAHAVAKHGIPSPGDYAFISLDPTTGLSISGSPTIQTVGSVFANGGITVTGGGVAQTCDGGWYSAGAVSNVSTDTTGTSTFAPTACSPAALDSSPLQQPNLAQIGDPYGSTVPPPGSYPNCTECSQAGSYYDLDTGRWYTDSGGGFPQNSDLELFPGIYSSNLGLGNSNIAYFNPGVYTFTGGIDTQHGLMCVYGSPSCNNTTCMAASFLPGSVAGDQWNYRCSPYGFWDSSAIAGRPPSLSAVPMFYDSSLGSNSSVPLNGVTIYLPAGDPNMTNFNGNAGKTGGIYLAAPAPCPGTGTYTSSPGAVSFPAGSASGTFAYSTSTNTWGLPRGVTASTAGTVYPNVDWSLAGECNLPYTVWPGEMPKPQHLHFLFYDLSSFPLDISGASAQKMNGIFYAPSTVMKLNGAGKGGVDSGPPWIYGQLVIKSGVFSGNSYNDIAYRPCTGSSTPCGSGAGTQLIQ